MNNGRTQGSVEVFYIPQIVQHPIQSSFSTLSSSYSILKTNFTKEQAYPLQIFSFKIRIQVRADHIPC